MYATWNLPRWALSALCRGGHWDRFDLYLGLNPFYQRGDFDGDGRIDIAIQVRDKSSGKRGIVVIHRIDASVYVLGAGVPIGAGGDDFSWLGVWRVESGDSLYGEPVPGRDVLLVEKPESAGGWLIWTGDSYTWRQGGD